MRHRVFGKKLSRNTGQRHSLANNLANSLLLHGSLTTTQTKAKFAGSYLENAPHLFGAELRTKEGGRWFAKKESHTPLDDPTFLGCVLEYLGSNEKTRINSFYLQRTLERIWLEAKAYDGFTLHDVLEAAKPDGYPLSLKTVTVNFARFSDELGVEIISDYESDVRIYRRKTVEVNDRQRDALAKALQSLGMASFTDQGLAARVKQLERGYEISTAVAQHFMANELGEGYRKISDEPLTYQSTMRPQAAADLVTAHQEDPDSVF